MTACDYIVVGQGLAGSVLAYQLLQRGYTIRVFDKPDLNCCSSVAAGLFNPITEVRVMKKTWMADQLFPSLSRFYRAAERRTGRRFFFPLSLYRPFEHVGEQNEWMGKSSMPEFAAYIREVVTEPRFDTVLRDPWGGLLLRQTGHVDTRIFIQAVREELVRAEAYRDEIFSEDRLEVFPDGVRYDGLTAHKIIFCQGVHALQSRYFGWVPIRKLKGEVLQIACSLPRTVIFNRGIYLVPDDLNTWKAGATYFYREVGPGVTVEGREELEARLRALLKVPYQVAGQSWGLRPAAPDRRPIIGAHPASGALLFFNGMGTKGVSLAPFFADQLISWLDNAGFMNEEVAITRYKSLYSKPA